MGHERVGALPHTKRWRDVVDQISASEGTPEEVAELAIATLQNVRVQFRNLHADDGVVAAFQFLLALTKSASPDGLPPDSFALAINLDARPSTLRLVAELRSWVDAQNGSRVRWTRGIGQKQGGLSESPCFPARDSVPSPVEHLFPSEFGLNPPAIPDPVHRHGRRAALRCSRRACPTTARPSPACYSSHRP